MPTAPSTEQAQSCITLMIEREVSQIGFEPETLQFPRLHASPVPQSNMRDNAPLMISIQAGLGS